MKQFAPDNTTARKCLGILMAFTPLNRDLGTVEISRVLGLNKSTVSKLLSVLKEADFVQQNPANKKYSLGPAIAKLGQARVNSANSRFVESAKPLLEQIRDELEQTVILSLPSSHAIVQAYVAEGVTTIRVVAYPGNINPYHSTSGGKVLLAFGPPDIQKRILAGKLEKKTDYTITDPEELRKVLDRVRRDGFCFNRQEQDLAINGFAVPVFDKDGFAVAAVVTAGSSQIVTWERRREYVPVLKEGADKISTIL